jgi:hypothetical protein
MKLLGPYEEVAATAAHLKVGDAASDWFQSLIISQVHEKRDSGACNGAEDLGYAVGGVNTTNIIMMSDAGTLFLGKKICAAITIPKDTFTSRRLLEGQQRREEEKSWARNLISGGRVREGFECIRSATVGGRTGRGFHGAISRSRSHSSSAT